MGKGKRPTTARGRPSRATRAKPDPNASTNSDPNAPSAPPLEIQKLGAPPDDPLAAQAYLYQLLVISAYDVARDTKISPRERRKELRTITASAQKLMPRARLFQAEQLVLKNKAELEQKARERQGAKLEPLPRKAVPAPAEPTVPVETDGQEQSQ